MKERKKDCLKEIERIDSLLTSLAIEKSELEKNFQDIELLEQRMDSNANSLDNLVSKCKDLIEKDRKEMLLNFDEMFEKDFEPKWKEWNCNQMFVWFKYLINNVYFDINNNNRVENENEDLQDKKDDLINGQIMETPGASGPNDKQANKSGLNQQVWDEILLKLQRFTRDFGSKYLLLCDENELKKLGFENDKIRKFLVKKIEQLTSKYGKNKQEKKRNECSICLETVTNTVFVPCGHACMCKECSNTYDKTQGCPICRKEIEMVIDLFIA